MFYYYGGKRDLARAFPPPYYGLIIEPFAGSAAYAMHYLAHADRVLLIEKDPRVVELWHRLLAMEPADVLAIRVPQEGEDISDFLYMTAAASNAIANCRRMTCTERMPRIIAAMLRRMAVALPTLKGRVEVIQGDYTDAPDVEATWFIDPPYEVNSGGSSKTAFPQGMGYAPGCTAADLDFAALGDWCRSRRGQVMVCEQQGASWLDFMPMAAKTWNSVGRGQVEVAWTNSAWGQQVLL